MTTFDRAEAEISEERVAASLAGAKATTYWLDDPGRPEALPPLRGNHTADLVIVGGGYTGLWTALLAKERDPKRKVVLLEGQRVGWAASGRNGGFCEASLTHGASNGKDRLPHEFAKLQALGLENLREIGDTVKRYSMDCDYEETGVLRVATEPHQVTELEDEAVGDSGVEFFDRQQVQAEAASPLYLAGAYEREGTSLVNPAKLVWELRRVVLGMGVAIFENTPVRSLDADGGGITVGTDEGSVYAQRVALGTNAFPALIKRDRFYTVPVYDYVLMTNPMSDEQLESIGWKRRQGITDLNNRFHYSRLVTDADGRTRILYGGYDAVYNYGGRIKKEYDQRPETFEKLAAHFIATYPQLEGLGFSHKWGGVIDTCTRFFSFFDTEYDGRVAHAAGFTGLGVGATRYAANVLLDLLSGEETERTRMDFVKKKPLPFPPEPFASFGAKVSLAEMARADRNEGKRGLWLKTMDAVGLGFDS
ncbi:NAD(P)/FAD-dependent oxidoreductase [Pseudoclavibacter sp. VKM Ac-2888]|uniref:NAD(P)/FAD-dependent oxidoreductase n=1 Tax=Pseudoclavibacter sp. VKM Ac-2888 TaxID=2783830 RepID=UPI00188A2256|nr:FAD-dependent oxidoreductase [Pseudoclavibacter sp. VKM Ac-2888]MBF4550915.1 FAD-dependent oxidoreductase [Pseudoclavibacter sp. VKM Ac-2888]